MTEGWEVAYPPAPWHFEAEVWAGLFRTDTVVPLPGELRPLLGRRQVVILLVRYLEGTLQYDELAIGPPVRLGARAGLFIEHMWVDDRASLWGGRRIWGLPKQLAEFAWEGDRVRITDAEGTVAVLSMDRRATWLPPVWAPAPVFGRLNGGWAFAVGQMWGRPGSCRLRVLDWPSHLGYRPAHRPSVGFAARPARLTMEEPRVLGE